MLSLLNRIKSLSSKYPTPLQLDYIYQYGKGIDTNKIIRQSQFLHKELPIRLAHRIVDLQKLPYDLTQISYLQNVHDRYVKSLEEMVEMKVPETLNDSDNFTELIKNIRERHTDLEYDISKALNIYKQNKDWENNIDHILDNFYMSRIGIRFLIGQHILVQQKHKDNIKSSDQIGMITNTCSPHEVIKQAINAIEDIFFNYIEKPEIHLDNHSDFKFTYIPAHIHYIVFELLKNSMLATIERNSMDIDMAPIKIKLFIGENDVCIKIIDRGGGFSRKDLSKVFKYTYTTSNLDISNTKNVQIAGFGHGLGLSRLYARYFGGDLVLVPIEGEGVDATIYINRLNTKTEQIKY